MAFYKVNGQLAFWPDGQVPPWPQGTYTVAQDPNAVGVSKAYIDSPAYAWQKAQDQYKQRNPAYAPPSGGGGLPRGPSVQMPVGAATPPGGRNPNTGGAPSGYALPPGQGGGFFPTLNRANQQNITNAFAGQTAAVANPADIARWRQRFSERLQPRYDTPSTTPQVQGEAIGGGNVITNPKLPNVIDAPVQQPGTPTPTGYAPTTNTTGYKDHFGNLVPQNQNDLWADDPASHWKKAGDLGYATRDEMYAGRAPELSAREQARQLQDYGYNAANPYTTVENDPYGTGYSSASSFQGYADAPNRDDPFNQRTPAPTVQTPRTPAPGGVGR